MRVLLLKGHGHRRQGASFGCDRDSGIPGQVSTSPPMRVVVQQDRAIGRRESDGTKVLDSLVLHTGTEHSILQYTLVYVLQYTLYGNCICILICDILTWTFPRVPF